VDLEGMAFDLVTPDGVDRVKLALVGRHNVANATAAAAAAVALGIARDAIVCGLESAVPAPMRLTVEKLANGVRLVNDAYNANPGSMRAAIAALEPLAARSVIVLGDMLELGERSAALHAEIGEVAARIGPRFFCAIGPSAEHYLSGARAAGAPADRVVAARTHAEGAEAVARAWREGDTVLVKGSRGARMEDVVVALRRLAKP
jgi:UDP-N-acetylmuramoyl-tripeptide--D-alanyl-D-alanine ligase